MSVLRSTIQVLGCYLLELQYKMVSFLSRVERPGSNAVSNDAVLMVLSQKYCMATLITLSWSASVYMLLHLLNPYDLQNHL